MALTLGFLEAPHLLHPSPRPSPLKGRGRIRKFFIKITYTRVGGGVGWGGFFVDNLINLIKI
jgi:hypothetical protein